MDHNYISSDYTIDVKIFITRQNRQYLTSKRISSSVKIEYISIK